MNKKEFTFMDDIFSAIVVVRIENTGEERYQALVRAEEKKDKKGNLILRHVMILENRKDFYTLMHECLHLVKGIFVDRGIPFSAENDEAVAYYQEYWFKRIWREISKKSNK